MTKVFRHNRIASDEDIIRLNSVGLSLKTIGDTLGVHPTTITQRLKALGIPPADTRRTFIDQLYHSLTLPQQEWLERQLGPDRSIRDFIKSQIVKAFVESHTPE